MNHLREELHTKAKQLMAKDDFKSAQSVLKDCLLQHGPYVLVLADLACCYYMLQDYFNYRRQTEFLLKEYKEVAHQLRAETRERVILAMGKLLEELGQVGPALAIYDDVLGRSEGSSSRVQMIHAQKLRLTCLLRNFPEMSAAYIICEQFRVKDQDAEVDLQHALLCIDYEVLGFHAASERVANLLRQNNLRASDKRLVAFDFLFEILIRRDSHRLDKSYFEAFSYGDLDAFEKALLDLYLVDLELAPNAELSISRSEEMSPLCGLRYLYLLSLTTSSEEARKKFLFLIQSLDADSRNVLLKNWPLPTSNKSLILINIENETAQCNGQFLDLRRNPALFRFLHMFSEKREWSADEAFLQLFDLPFELSSESRLRNTVSRANHKLEPWLGLLSPFILKKQGLSLSSYLEIKRISSVTGIIKSS